MKFHLNNENSVKLVPTNQDHCTQNKLGVLTDCQSLHTIQTRSTDRQSTLVSH